jgi:dTDP-glucose pyrophosphorylase
MLNILIPIAGSSAFFPDTDHGYPKIFQEVLGKPMIQICIENLMGLVGEKKFIFIVNEADVNKYRLDNVLKILTDNNYEIIIQKNPVKGAVCSILLATKFLNDESPILISNADQIIDRDPNQIMGFFNEGNIDGGVVCFDSVHPQWSYARLINGNQIIETAEKQPISRNAIAGLYYFARGSEFIECAMDVIFKDRSYKGKYYTSCVLNEMVLKNKNLRALMINSSEYHSFYSPEKIKEFEQRFKGV